MFFISVLVGKNEEKNKYIVFIQSVQIEQLQTERLSNNKVITSLVQRNISSLESEKKK